MNKDQIISEIHRTAKENKGSPLGQAKFESETGIKVSDWSGIYWTKWGDALTEAGYKPKKLIEPYNEEFLIKKLIDLIRENHKFPTQREIKLKHYNDKEFPSISAFDNRLGKKCEKAKKVADYCKSKNEFIDVLEICLSELKDYKEEQDTIEADDTEEIGFVYLVKYSKYYKIGRTKDIGKRIYDLRLQLPEKPKLIHKIKTGDPVGIELYWQKYFKEKRKGGEWFELTSNDVKYFKRRKFM